MDALGARYPDFGELIRRLGSVQIRNAGTIGGNIANGSPIGDSMPAADRARRRAGAAQGQRAPRAAARGLLPRLPQDRAQPGEFVERSACRCREPEQQFRCYKISKRFDQDISALLGAFDIQLAKGRVLTCGSPSAAWRRSRSARRRASRRCAGSRGPRRPSRAGREALAQDFPPISDMRASAAYRLLAAQNLLTKFHVETSAPAVPTRVLELEVSHG